MQWTKRARLTFEEALPLEQSFCSLFPSFLTEQQELSSTPPSDHLKQPNINMLSNLAVVALAAAGAVNAGPLRRQATSAVESASSIASEASSAASSAVSSVVSGASSTAASEASGASSTAAGKSFSSAQISFLFHPCCHDPIDFGWSAPLVAVYIRSSSVAYSVPKCIVPKCKAYETI